MTKDIINVIEELIGLTYCTAPAEDVVREVVEEGERVIGVLKEYEKTNKTPSLRI